MSILKTEDLRQYIEGFIAEFSDSKTLDRHLRSLIEAKESLIRGWVALEVEKKMSELEEARILRLLQEIVDEDSIHDLMPRVEPGLYPKDGASDYAEVLDMVKICFEVWHDEHPQLCPVLQATCPKCDHTQYDSLALHKWDDIEAVAKMLWKEIEKAREDAIDDYADHQECQQEMYRERDFYNSRRSPTGGTM